MNNMLDIFRHFHPNSFESRKLVRFLFQFLSSKDVLTWWRIYQRCRFERVGRRLTCAFLPLGSGKFVWPLEGWCFWNWHQRLEENPTEDAFDTESDALDYCNDLLLEDPSVETVEIGRALDMEVFRGSMFSWFVKEHYYQQSDVEGYKKARLTPESIVHHSPQGLGDSKSPRSESATAWKNPGDPRRNGRYLPCIDYVSEIFWNHEALTEPI